MSRCRGCPSPDVGDLTATGLCLAPPDPTAWSFAETFHIAVTVLPNVSLFHQPWWRYLLTQPVAAVELRWSWGDDPEMQEGAVNQILANLGGVTSHGFTGSRSPLELLDTAALARDLAVGEPAAAAMMSVARTMRPWDLGALQAILEGRV
jgi:hypothetical protein